MNIEKVKISTSSKENFLKDYEQIISIFKEEKIPNEIFEDDISLGASNKIITIATITFILNSSLSGISWDTLKHLASKIYSNLSTQKRENIDLIIEYKEDKNKKSFKVEVSGNEDGSNIDIKLPNEIEIEINNGK